MKMTWLVTLQRGDWGVGAFMVFQIFGLIINGKKILEICTFNINEWCKEHLILERSLLVLTVLTSSSPSPKSWSILFSLSAMSKTVFGPVFWYFCWLPIWNSLVVVCSGCCHYALVIWIFPNIPTLAMTLCWQLLVFYVRYWMPGTHKVHDATI